MLHVYLHGRHCGVLEDQGLGLSFTYDSDWKGERGLQYISASLQADMMAGSKVEAFFSNLLPEGQMRQILATDLGCSADQLMPLLLRYGGDCAGAITILETSQSFEYGTNGYKPFLIEDLTQYIKEQPYSPLLQFKDGLRLTLAGAQQKIPLYRDQHHELFLPEGTSISNGILKVRLPGYPSSTINEYFCMKLAKQVGMNVPDVALFDDGLGLWVDRFDRVEEDGVVLPIHQEDGCQILSIDPERKYEADGGPSVQDCVEMIKQYSSQQALDLMAFLQWIIFNVCVGNHSAHAKNMAFLHWGAGEQQMIKLAPFYDVISTSVYDSLEHSLAMSIGGEYEISALQPRHFGQMADACGLSHRFVLDVMRKTTQKLLSMTPPLAAKVMHVDPACIGHIENHIMDQARKLTMWEELVS